MRQCDACQIASDLWVARWVLGDRHVRRRSVPQHAEEKTNHAAMFTNNRVGHEAGMQRCGRRAFGRDYLWVFEGKVMFGGLACPVARLTTTGFKPLGVTVPLSSSVVRKRGLLAVR